MQKFSRLVRGAARRDPSKRARARRGVTSQSRRRADLELRRVALDRLGRGPLARLARRRRPDAAARRRAERVRGGRDEQFDDCVLLGMGGSSLAPEVLRRAFGVESFHVLDTTHPDGDPPARARASTSSGRSSSPRRSRARRSRRARTSTTSGSGPAAAAPSSRRSPIPARSSTRSRTSAASAPSSPASRRSAAATRRSRMFGIVPAALMGVDLEPLPRARGGDGRGAAGSTRATRGSSSGSRSARAGRTGRDKVCIDDAPTGLRALGRAAARGVDRQAGQGPRARARRVARRARPAARRGASSPTRTTSAPEFFRWEFATAVAGHVLGINPFDQPDVQAAKDKTNEVLAAGEPDLEPRGSLDELLAQAQAGRDYVCIQAFVDPAREDELAPLLDACARDRLRRHARASARATCTRPASCTRAARTPASSSRSSTTPATSCRSPAATSASAA